MIGQVAESAVSSHLVALGARTRAGVRAEQTAWPGLLQTLVWSRQDVCSEHWGQGTGCYGSTGPERSQGWEALGGSHESIKDLCHTLALPLVTSLTVASVSRRAQAYFSLSVPTSWTLSLVAVRADGGGLMVWGRAAANTVVLGRELTSVQEHLCPCQGLGFSAACLPLTQELASATHSDSTTQTPASPPFGPVTAVTL